MKANKRDRYDENVMNQNCAEYLRHLGLQIVDGEGINCPYRPSSDSGSFVVNGPLWYDHARGEGGNVWQLALNMNAGDKRMALQSLHGAVGVPFVPDDKTERLLSERERAHAALKKAYDAFRIDVATTPKHVLDYLEKRKVGDKTHHYLGFIPKGQLGSVLSEEEIALTGLGHREELIILWYFKGGAPVYYCTRDISTKAFKKASLGSGILTHPIWNVDSLYRDEHVVWGEGMFDCTSLIELGFGVAGEITSNLIAEHKPELLKALRWRAKHHPDWTFTICLDNDEPGEDGRRRGNEAAEQLAIGLWGNGVDVKWVKHDPAEEKVDINLLHQNGMGSTVRKMIEGAKHLSEILAYDEVLCLRNFTRMIAHQDYLGTRRLMGLMEKQHDNAKIKAIVDLTHTIRWNWRDVYTDKIKDIFTFGSEIYVVFDKGRFGESQKHYEVFRAADLTRNLQGFQWNTAQQISLSNLDLEYRRPTWRVSRVEQPSKSTFNLFCPSPLLLQERSDWAFLPDQWERLMDNLAGKVEKEWFLNHMAVYVQTLEKPRTIPVIVGKQGTGKTKCMELFGRGIGGFMTVGNGLVETQFNEFLLNPVVLLDELANSQRDSNQLKNRLKQLINETQTINAKHRNPFSMEVNNYIAVASNEQTSYTPLAIESDDRRYCIISGGKDLNLEHERWYDYKLLVEQLPDFMLYLLSRPIDKNAASRPLSSDKKQQLADASQDYKVACVRAHLDEKRGEITTSQTMKLSHLSKELNEGYHPQFQYMPRSLRPILRGLGYGVTLSHNQLIVTINPYGDDPDDGGDGGGGLAAKGGVTPPGGRASDADGEAHEASRTGETTYEDLFGS